MNPQMNIIEKLFDLLSAKDYKSATYYLSAFLLLFFPSILYILLYDYSTFVELDTLKIIFLSIMSNFIVIFITGLLAFDQTYVYYRELKILNKRELVVRIEHAKVITDFTNKVVSIKTDNMGSEELKVFLTQLEEISELIKEAAKSSEKFFEESVSDNNDYITYFLLLLVAFHISLSLILIVFWVLGFDVNVGSSSMGNIFMSLMIANNILILDKLKRSKQKFGKIELIRIVVLIVFIIILVAQVIF